MKSDKQFGGDNFSTDDCYVEQQIRGGHKRNCSYPDNGIPEVKKYADKGIPSLLATAFGIKGRDE